MKKCVHLRPTCCCDETRRYKEEPHDRQHVLVKNMGWYLTYVTVFVVERVAEIDRSFVDVTITHRREKLVTYNNEKFLTRGCLYEKGTFSNYLFIYRYEKVGNKWLKLWLVTRFLLLPNFLYLLKFLLAIIDTDLFFTDKVCNFKGKGLFIIPG